MILNNKLKEVREKNGLTQSQISSICGISVMSYFRYENDERLPNVVVAIRIAEALGIRSFEKFKDLFGAATPKEDKGNDTSKE